MHKNRGYLALNTCMRTGDQKATMCTMTDMFNTVEVVLSVNVLV